MTQPTVIEEGMQAGELSKSPPIAQVLEDVKAQEDSLRVNLLQLISESYSPNNICGLCEFPLNGLSEQELVVHARKHGLRTLDRAAQIYLLMDYEATEETTEVEEREDPVVFHRNHIEWLRMQNFRFDIPFTEPDTGV